MIEFSKLCVEVLPGGRFYRLTEPMRVTLNGRPLCTVPAGFITDFASVPRALWSIIPPHGKYSPAAVLHDYLYFTAMFPRAYADDIFLDAMRDLGVAMWKRWAMYAGVRVGGWVGWNAYRREQ